MVRIFLIGYMGAGKTTLGHALAEATGLSFIDLDWRIEGRFHKSVNEVFAERGEEGFRLLERGMLHEVADFEDVVVSVGGGTPCFFDNIDYMNACGETVYLKASPDTLLKHIAMSRGQRPLLKGKSPEELRTFITMQLQEREPYYLKARHVVNIDVLDDSAKISAIANQIRTLLHL